MKAEARRALEALEEIGVALDEGATPGLDVMQAVSLVAHEANSLWHRIGGVRAREFLARYEEAN